MVQPNELDFLPGVSALTWDWRNLGTVFGRPESVQTLTARTSFVVRQGYDVHEDADYGQVVEGTADLGINLKTGSNAIHVSAANMFYRRGQDDPCKAQAVVDEPLPSLKVALAKEIGDDCYCAASYDVKQKKPEFSICWTGDANWERATLLVTADPVYGKLRVHAALETTGPEWRTMLYDEETEKIEEIKDTGARHRFWVENEVHGRRLLARTFIGARLDLGRVVNYLTDKFDEHVQPVIPRGFWRLPFAWPLYKLLIPPYNDDQERRAIHNWDFEIKHDFELGKPSFALTKRLPNSSIGWHYALADNTMGLNFRVSGLGVTAKLGQRHDGWKAPSLHFYIEPFSLLL